MATKKMAPKVRQAAFREKKDLIAFFIIVAPWHFEVLKSQTGFIDFPPWLVPRFDHLPRLAGGGPDAILDIIDDLLCCSPGSKDLCNAGLLQGRDIFIRDDTAANNQYVLHPLSS